MDRFDKLTRNVQKLVNTEVLSQSVGPKKSNEEKMKLWDQNGIYY